MMNAELLTLSVFAALQLHAHRRASATHLIPKWLTVPR